MIGSLLMDLPFAQITRWQRLGDGLHRGRGRMDLMELLPVAIALAVVAIGIGLVVTLRKRNDMSQKCDDPKKLFRELCLAHQLDRSSHKLLWKLAEACHLDQPAEVFLKPALFQAEKLPPQLCREAASLQALRERLF